LADLHFADARIGALASANQSSGAVAFPRLTAPPFAARAASYTLAKE